MLTMQRNQGDKCLPNTRLLQARKYITTIIYFFFSSFVFPSTNESLLVNSFCKSSFSCTRMSIFFDISLQLQSSILAFNANLRFEFSSERMPIVCSPDESCLVKYSSLLTSSAGSSWLLLTSPLYERFSFVDL